MKLKQLVALLQGVPEFAAPDYELEQYKTNAALAAEVVYAIEHAYADFGERVVADLGCGTGVLGLGAAALGARAVVGFDVDVSALYQAAETAEELGLADRVDYVRADVFAIGESLAATVSSELHAAGPGAGAPPAGIVRRRQRLRGSQLETGRAVGSVNVPTALESDVAGGMAANAGEGGDGATLSGSDAHAAAAAVAGSVDSAARAVLRAYEGVFDTVITNPPFGTRRAGADLAFVRAGLALTHASGVVYSLHKSSTRAHLLRAGAAGLGVGVELVAQLRFRIPATYAFHRADFVDVDVDLLRFVKGPPAAVATALARMEAIPKYVAPPAAGEERAGAAGRRGKGGGVGRR